MSLTVCSGCQRHVRDGEGCPFCGGRPPTAVHVWKAAVLTAMVPLGLAACYGGPVTEGAGEAAPPASETKPDAKPPEVKAEPEVKPEPQDPTVPTPEPVEPDSADPDPSGHDPETPDPVDTAGGDNSKPEGTDTPIVEDIRPAKKYGAPPRPKPKYGGPPRPKPKPTPPPKPAPGD